MPIAVTQRAVCALDLGDDAAALVQTSYRRGAARKRELLRREHGNAALPSEKEPT